MNNNEQKLGIRVFYYYLSKNIALGICLVVVAIIVSSIKSPFMASSTGSSFLTILTLVAFAVVIYEILSSWLKYIGFTFSIDENSITIKEGIFSKKELSIPYRQIQDVSIEQSFTNRMLGVSKLVILTAANDDADKEGEAEGVFNIIDARIAQDLRASILSKSNLSGRI